MKTALVILCLFQSVAAFAGESGVIFQGKKYVLFKDGKKVGEEPEALRKPASISESTWMSIRYTIDPDNGVICYYNNEGSGEKAAISCVKK